MDVLILCRDNVVYMGAVNISSKIWMCLYCVVDNVLYTWVQSTLATRYGCADIV